MARRQNGEHRSKQQATLAEYEQHRTAMMQMWIQGYSQADIATHFGLTQPTISNHLRRVRDEWRADRVGDMDELKALEMARIDAVQREAWDAWRLSLEPVEREVVNKAGRKNPPAKTKAKRDSADDDRVSVTAIDITTYRQRGMGNPKYLDIILKCIEQRSRLLGLTQPTPVVIVFTQLVAALQERGISPDEFLSVTLEKLQDGR